MKVSDKAVLLDLLSVSTEEIEATPSSQFSKNTLYSEVGRSMMLLTTFTEINSSKYLPTSTLVAGVKSGEFHQGYFNANPYNYLEVGIIIST